MRGIAGVLMAAVMVASPAWGAEISFASGQGVGVHSSGDSYTVVGAIGNLVYGYADFQLKGNVDAYGNMDSFETNPEAKLALGFIPGVGLTAAGKEKQRQVGAGADGYSLTASATSGITTEPRGPEVSLGGGPVSVSWQVPIGIAVKTSLEAAIGGDPPYFVGGWATAAVVDPFHLVNWETGMVLPLELGWGSGFEMRADGLDGALERQTTWGTNIAGFEELLTVLARVTPGASNDYSDPSNFILEVFVTSHPSLGLDDAALEASLLGSLLYTGFGSFEMMNDLTFFNGDFVPPDGTTEFEFYMTDSVFGWVGERPDPSTFEYTRVGDEGEAPEPGTWALMGVGLAGLAWKRRRGGRA